MVKAKKVLIIGGGFGGVSAALNLARKKLPNLNITLVTQSPHFEYHAGLYRVLTGKSPLEVCVPLRDIFKGYDVNLVEDKIIDLNFQAQTAHGVEDGIYHYDYLVLALGSEPAYYDIPGLAELSFSLRSIKDAIQLNRHLHKSFLECTLAKDKKDSMCNTHIVVIGGGATGCEVAGELAVFTKLLAKKHGLDQSMVTIDLITSPSRLMTELSEKVSKKIENRLHQLGVNIYLNRRLLKEEVEGVYLKDVRLETKTAIWAAGVKGNFFYKDVELPVDEKGRVIVDEYLRPQGRDNVFIVGDGAATEYSGMAQTAMYDGEFVADNIVRELKGYELKGYQSKPTSYRIPVGPNWAVSNVLGMTFYGKMGWFFKRLNDWKFFRSILPFGKAWSAFHPEKIMWEDCPICSSKN